MLRGFLDRVTWNSLDGWAYDPEHPETPVELEVLDDGAAVCRFVANRYRADLEKVGREGRCSFSLRLPLGWSGMTERAITVRRVSDGAVLAGSPRSPERPDDAAERMRQSVGQLVRAAAADGVPQDPAERDRLLGVLADAADRLLRARLSRGEPAAIDAEAFYERWRPLLSDPTVPVLRQAADRPVELRKRALFIDDSLPRPACSIAQAALLDHMAALRRLGFEVVFAPQDMREDAEASAALEAAGVACCLAPFYASVEEVMRRQAGTFDVVYLRGTGNFMQYAAMARQHVPKARLIYAAGTLGHLHLSRRAAMDELAEIMRQSRAAKAMEAIAARMADSILTHSPYDARLVARDAPRADVHAIGWTVPLRRTAVPFSDRRDVAFLAGDAEDATIDAVLWLMEGIMPRLRALDPDVRCFVLAGPTARRLPRGETGGLVFLGEDEDAAALLDRVRLTVAPLRYGAGLNGRVLQSLAAGIPCICSPVAAEGLTLPPALEALVASTPARLAELMHRLHGEEVENALCAKAGLDLVGEGFSADRIEGQLSTLLRLNDGTATRAAGR